MLNLLKEYIPHSLPELGDFNTRPSLEMKVSPDGTLLPFHGDTTVFLLDEDTKRELSLLQDRLYSAAAHMLAQKLHPGTFHMTLHDLKNSPHKDKALEEAMEHTKVAAKALIDRWRDLPSLRMRATWLFNMVNTSIVLGLEPADERSWQQLDGMYMAMEEIVPLGYALTPHITMAYFRPGCYSRQDLEALRSALCPVALEIGLDMASLCYQRFSDMNSYYTF